MKLIAIFSVTLNLVLVILLALYHCQSLRSSAVARLGLDRSDLDLRAAHGELIDARAEVHALQGQLDRWAGTAPANAPVPGTTPLISETSLP